MQIKRYEAKNMTTALRMIKDELGPDAVILSARSLRKSKSFFGSLQYAGVEVTAAIDNQMLPLASSNFESRKSGFSNNVLPGLPEDYRANNREAIQSKNYSEKNPADQQQNYSAKRRWSRRSERLLSSLYRLILAQEVDRSIAIELIERIKHNPVNHENLQEEDVRCHLNSILKEMGVVVARDVFATRHPDIYMFIGCTGVGKTTAIAKLAALQASKFKKRVALITIDNYGIAAVEQLKCYAQIIGVPLETAANPIELKQCVKKYRGNDLILIDTPGINPNNKRLIQELKGHFDSLSALQSHLVVSATTKETDVVAIMEALKDLRIHRLMFTKLDESNTCGNMVNLLIRTRIPLSFLCSGQKVPDDIEAGSTEKLSDMILKTESICNPKSAARLELHDSQGKNVNNSPVAGAYFFANQNSDIYHLADCKWSQKIKPDNIIHFSSAQEAEAQRFLPCSSCNPNRLGYGDDSDRYKKKIKLSRYR